MNLRRLEEWRGPMDELTVEEECRLYIVWAATAYFLNHQEYYKGQYISWFVEYQDCWSWAKKIGAI